MKRAVSVLIVLVAALGAGPVGEYLGISVNRQFADVRIGRDSIHYYYGQPDYVAQWSSIDTTCVISETTLQGQDAWLSTVISYRYDRAVSVDTVLEQGDTMLVGRRTLAGLQWRPNLYRVPFAVGSWWRSGTAGIWYADFTGDGRQDTMVVTGDTVCVEAAEDVSVPFRTIPGCWRLRSFTRQTLHFVTQGYSIVESTRVYQTEWYKDSLGWVKDSSVTLGADYVDYGGLIINDRFVFRSWGILDGWRPAVGEAARTRDPVPMVRPNPCRDRLELTGCDGAVLYSTDGRRVAELVHGHNSVSGLSRGIYVLRAAGSAPVRVIKAE